MPMDTVFLRSMGCRANPLAHEARNMETGSRLPCTVKSSNLYLSPPTNASISRKTSAS
jgi:hypothetical protein